MCFSFSSDFKLKELEKTSGAIIAQKSFDLFHEDNPDGLQANVFPNTYAPVVVFSNNQKIICPMRYRIRPEGSTEEVPSKYNLYNARMESIQSKDTWKKLTGKKHAVIPLRAFNEWVSTEKGKKIVQFSIKDRPTLWAAGLFDIWQNPKNHRKLLSFAIITKAPPSSIQSVGHDRCPLLLENHQLETWLNTKNTPYSKFQEILKSDVSFEFEHQFTGP